MQVSPHTAQASQKPLWTRQRDVFRCLDDTVLKLPDVSITHGSLKLLHMIESSEDAHAIPKDGIHLLSLLREFFEVSRQERPAGSLRPFGPGYLRLRGPVSAPLQGGVRFLRHLLPAPSSAFLTVGFATEVATGRAYRVPCLRHDGSGLDYPPAALVSVCPHL
jgi:hypothetical protein